jgi:hypothetical protein
MVRVGGLGVTPLPAPPIEITAPTDRKGLWHCHPRAQESTGPCQRSPQFGIMCFGHKERSLPTQRVGHFTSVLDTVESSLKTQGTPPHSPAPSDSGLTSVLPSLPASSLSTLLMLSRDCSQASLPLALTPPYHQFGVLFPLRREGPVSPLPADQSLCLAQSRSSLTSSLPPSSVLN